MEHEILNIKLGSFWTDLLATHVAPNSELWVLNFSVNSIIYAPAVERE